VQQQHPLTAGVTVIVTRHLGPYKRVIRAPFSLWQTNPRWTVGQAAERSAALDRRQKR